MSQSTKEYFDIMKEICGSNQDAYNFVVQSVGAALTFDHIWDGDEINKEDSQRVLESLTLYWPLNPFIRANAPMLVSAMSQGLEEWRSNEDEYGIYKRVASVVCFCIGGQPLVDAYMPRIRRIVLKEQHEDDVRDGQDRS